MPEVQHSYHPPEEYCSFEIVVLFNAYPLEESLSIEKKKGTKTKIQQAIQRLKQENSLKLGTKFKPLPTYRRGFSLLVQTMKPFTDLTNDAMNEVLISGINILIASLKQIGKFHFYHSQSPAPQGTDVIEQEEIADPQLSGEVLPTKQRNESLCSLPFSSNDTFFPIMSSSPEELTNYCSPPEEVAAIKRYDELLEENQELRKENKMMVQMILQRNKELQKEKDALMGELCDSRIQIAHLEMQLDMMQAQRDNMKDQRDSLMDMLKNQ